MKASEWPTLRRGHASRVLAVFAAARNDQYLLRLLDQVDFTIVELTAAIETEAVRCSPVLYRFLP